MAIEPQPYEFAGPDSPTRKQLIDQGGQGAIPMNPAARVQAPVAPVQQAAPAPVPTVDPNKAQQEQAAASAANQAGLVNQYNAGPAAMPMGDIIAAIQARMKAPSPQAPTNSLPTPAQFAQSQAQGVQAPNTAPFEGTPVGPMLANFFGNKVA